MSSFGAQAKSSVVEKDGAVYIGKYKIKTEWIWSREDKINSQVLASILNGRPDYRGNGLEVFRAVNDDNGHVILVSSRGELREDSSGAGQAKVLITMYDTYNKRQIGGYSKGYECFNISIDCDKNLFDLVQMNFKENPPSRYKVTDVVKGGHVAQNTLKYFLEGHYGEALGRNFAVKKSNYDTQSDLYIIRARVKVGSGQFHYYYAVIDNDSDDDEMYLISGVSKGALNRKIEKNDAEIQELFQ